MVMAHLQSGGEFHHLIGLDVLQSVDTGNTVTNAEHPSGLFQISLQTPCSIITNIQISTMT